MPRTLVKKKAPAKKKPTRKAIKATKKPAKVRRVHVKVAHGSQSVAEEMISKMRASKHAAHPDETFWVNNGPICQTIPELKVAITEMSDEQFDYHTKRNGNDFARWLEGAMCHDECARKITKARTRAAAIRALAVCDDD